MRAVARTALLAAPPSTIRDLAISTGGSFELGITFTAAKRAAYHQYRFEDFGLGNWSAPITVPGATLTMPADNNAYRVQVRGVNAAGHGQWSNGAIGFSG